MRGNKLERMPNQVDEAKSNTFTCGEKLFTMLVTILDLRKVDAKTSTVKPEFKAKSSLRPWLTMSYY